MPDTLKHVGVYNKDFNENLNINLPVLDIYVSEGLKVHIMNRHPNCLQYLGKIEDIIKSPDYIGKNPSEPNSIELVKVYDKNILVGIKLDVDKNYLYVSTLFDVSQGKIERRLNSGRIIAYRLDK